MLIKDINSPFEKKRIITYGCDNNKAVYHYVPLQQIINCLYKSKTEILSCGFDECRLYICFPGYPGLDIGSFSHINGKTVEDLWRFCVDSGLDTPENFIRMLDSRVQERQYIGNCQIELAKYIDSQKIERYVAVKKSIKKDWEHRQAELQAKYLAEQAEKERLIKQKKEEERALLLGWGDRMSDLHLGRVLSVLSVKFCYDGVVKTRLQHVIDCIAEGWIPKRRESVVSYYGNKWDRKASKPKTVYCLIRSHGEKSFSYAITKTEFEFATYLKEKTDEIHSKPTAAV